MLMGLSITSALVWVEWTPSLLQAVASGGESRLVVACSSPLGVVPSQPIASTTAAAEVMVATPTAAEAASEVTLVAPPPPAMAEEERETGLPALPGGGPHGSPSRSELEVPGGRAARLEPKCLPVAHETEVMEIPSDDKAGDEVELPALSQELAVVRSEAGPSSRLEEIDLVWPCLEDPMKVRFILQDT